MIVNNMIILTNILLRNNIVKLVKYKLNFRKGNLKQIILLININITSFIMLQNNLNNNTNNYTCTISIILNTYNRIILTIKEQNNLNKDAIDINDKTIAERSYELIKKTMSYDKEGMSKVKTLIAKYRYFLICTYLTVHVSTLSTLYLLLDGWLVHLC